MVNRPPVPDSVFNGFEIVIQNYNLACFLGGFRTAAHCKADIRTFQCRRVVHAIAGHPDYEVHFLTEAHHARLICRKCPGNHADIRYDFFHFLVGHFIQLCRRQRPVFFIF